MSTPIQIADTLGRKAMADRLGVAPPAVSNAVGRGRFPASWYGVISAMCAERDMDCPLDAFTMIGVAAEDAA